MLHLRKLSVLLSCYPIKDFQESNNFLKLCLSAFKTKKEPKVEGLIPIFSWDFSKMEKNEEVVSFLFKINQN